jgi:hypothetical protein
MSTNFLNYTEITYDEIKERIKSRLSEDSRFSNFSESQMYSMILEAFTALTDFSNYYIERRAQESFPGTAQLRSSIIEISKMLGYVIRRPIPATTSITMTLTSLPSGASAGQIISLDKFSNFSFNGLNFLLKTPIQYTLTQLDINNFANPNYFKVFEFYSTEPGKEYQLYDTELIPEQYRSPIELIQADRKSIQINSNDTQADQRYQTYKIDDKEFSDYFGENDFGFDVEDGSVDLTLNNTRIAIGLDESSFVSDMTEFDSKKEFIIDRRSFLNNYTIPLLTATDSGKSVKYCVLKTNMDDTVELKFADDVISSIGATGSNSIFIRYLATKGSAGNFVGVIGRKVESQQNSFGSNFTNSHIKFTLRRNIVGGSDIEDVESIKINTPEIFYSLDRCVTSRDYVNFLKTLAVKGKQIKNAKVWGEQEETRDNIYKIPNIKLFNVVLFSILADMYSKGSDGKYNGIEPLENILLDYNNSNDWFNLMVMSDSTTPLSDNTLNENPDLKILYDKLYSRSEITVKNIYVTPVIRDFKIGGYVYLNPLTDKNNVQKKISDALYSFLSKNADFNTPIYLSKIIEIIESFSEVNHADVYFIPNENPNKDYLFQSDFASELSAISANFNSLPIGFVFNSSVSAKDKCDVREYSISGVDDSFTFYQKRLSPILTSAGYTENTINTIACLMPRLEMKMYKYDDITVRTEPIWPSNNSVDNLTCGLPVSTSGDINWDFVPSERNMYLGMMKCFYDNLMKIVSRNPTLSKSSDDYIEGINKVFDEFLAGRDNCFCSLRQIGQYNQELATIEACKDYIKNADPNEINKFINNDLLGVLQLFRNTLATTITNGLLDSYGNIVNYSLRNEIARVEAPAISAYYYR